MVTNYKRIEIISIECERCKRTETIHVASQSSDGPPRPGRRISRLCADCMTLNIPHVRPGTAGTL
jgi:hypothetical protein